MKTLFATTVFAMVLATSAIADVSIPPQGTRSGGQGVGQKQEKPKEVEPCDRPFSNGDTTVTNECSSGGDVEVTPPNGDSNSSTTIRTEDDFDGTITGVDDNDTVRLGDNCQASVGTTGGHVWIGTGSSLEITCGGGGGATTVHLPGGGTMTLSPGSAITIEN